jgi:hypothetical protein
MEVDRKPVWSTHLVISRLRAPGERGSRPRSTGATTARASGRSRSTCTTTTRASGGSRSTGTTTTGAARGPRSTGATAARASSGSRSTGRLLRLLSLSRSHWGLPRLGRPRGTGATTASTSRGSGGTSSLALAARRAWAARAGGTGSAPAGAGRRHPSAGWARTAGAGGRGRSNLAAIALGEGYGDGLLNGGGRGEESKEDASHLGVCGWWCVRAVDWMDGIESGAQGQLSISVVS